MFPFSTMCTIVNMGFVDIVPKCWKEVVEKKSFILSVNVFKT